MIAASLAGVALSGCLGGDDTGAEGERGVTATSTERVNSATSFNGERRGVARAVERFEDAIRHRDRRNLCTGILAVREEAFGTERVGPDACLHDVEFSPAGELREAGVASAAYDLVVERVRISPRVDRFKPDATARVRMPAGAANPIEVFELQEVSGKWRISGRYAPDAGEEPDVGDLGCEDGSPGTYSSTDVFGIVQGAAPVPAQREFIRTWSRAMDGVPTQVPESTPPSMRAVAAIMDAESLVRVAIGYRFAAVTYELRGEDGVRRGVFELERFDGHWLSWRHGLCVRVLRAQTAGA